MDVTMAANPLEEESPTESSSVEDSVISDILLLRVTTIDIGKGANGSVAAEIGSSSEPVCATEAREPSRKQDTGDENTSQLTLANVSCCMWGYRILPEVIVTTRLMSGTRVGLASICQFPGRPLLTWPGHYTVESALRSNDWVEEVARPCEAELALGTVFSISNGTESTHVRMLTWQPTDMILANNHRVHTASCPSELCIGHGAVAVVEGVPVLTDNIEVVVLRAGMSPS